MSSHEKIRQPDVKSAAGCLIMSRKTGRFLFSLRPEGDTAGGKWSVWGGKAEYGETARETAVREVFEETGLRHSDEIFHVHHMETRSFSFDTYLMVVDEEFDPVRTVESDDHAWFALDDLPQNLHWGIEEMLSDRMSVGLLVKTVENTSGRPCSFESVYRKPKAAA